MKKAWNNEIPKGVPFQLFWYSHWNPAIETGGIKKSVFSSEVL